MVLWPSGGPEHCGDGRERELLSCGKREEKRYIACKRSPAGEEDFHTVMERLKEEAGRRAGIAQRKQLQEEEQKRLKRLEEIRDALPFRMGMKWGLKLGERIIVPPKYRKILPPVGYYCAYEENACQWGIMALDGKVVVEARYQKVDIECNGTVHLTVIPGKVKTIKTLSVCRNGVQMAQIGTGINLCHLRHLHSK